MWKITILSILLIYFSYSIIRNFKHFDPVQDDLQTNICTVNPHYNDSRYNDKIRYTDNLNNTETLHRGDR